MYSVSQEREVRYNGHTWYETSNPVKIPYCFRWVALLQSWSRCEGLGTRQRGMVTSTLRENRLYDNSDLLPKMRGWKGLNSYSSDGVPPWLHPHYRH